MTSIVVSSGGAGYGFLVDDQGRLRQAGFGPDIDTHMQHLAAGIPNGLYPLAYPAYDEESTHAPALRVTHSDGTTTTRLKVEDVRAVGPQTDILLVDPDCLLEVSLCFHAEDHGVLRQWVSVTNRQPGAVTLHEIAAQLERKTYEMGELWAISADPADGKIVVELNANNDPDLAEQLIKEALAELSIPVANPQ